MATTLSDLKTRLAYRLNENSSPDDTNENAKRVSFLNEGQRKVLGEKYWWFLQTTGSTTSLANTEIYTLPSNFRDMMELRVNRHISLPISKAKVFNNFEYPPLGYDFDTLVTRHWVLGSDELHIIPIPSTTPDTLTVSSISRSGSTATVTTSAAHSLKAQDRVTISGADQSDYNGTITVLTVPSTTTFTYRVSNSPTTPATGTITAQWNNIVYRYWQKHADMTSNDDTTLIPDDYADVIVCFALARKLSGPIEDERGSASDAVEEYNMILKDMNAENNRKKFMYKRSNPVGYQESVL